MRLQMRRKHFWNVYFAYRMGSFRWLFLSRPHGMGGRGSLGSLVTGSQS
jgi:hypothetical protein